MGKAVKLMNVPKRTHRLFRRALTITGAGSQSSWLLTKIRQYVREQQEKFGNDLFQVLTEEEKDILEIVASGAAELQHIAEESMLPEKHIEMILAELVDCGRVEERYKGGKTDHARGAKIKLYFVKK
jgi:hypothetical protein